MPYLFDPDPDALSLVGKPSAPRRVQDQHFDTLEQALEAAQTQDPVADPDKWQAAEKFQDSDNRPFSSLELGPEAERVGTLGGFVVVVAAVASFAALIIAANAVGGLEGDDADAPLVAALLLAMDVGGLTAYLIRRRNLAKERNR